MLDYLFRASLTNAMLAIVGEACSLLAEGETKEETVASLKSNGLSEECSTPFVDKAIQVVHSNRRTDVPGVSHAKHWFLTAVGLVLLVGLIVVGVIGTK